MRLSDLVVLLAALVVIAMLPRLGSRYRATATLTLVSAVALQLIEGWRWQLLPALGIVLIGIAVIQGRGGTPAPALAPTVRGRAVRRGTGLVGILAVLVSAGLAAALPVTGLPAPGGPYPVGTLTFTVTDDARIDPYAAQQQPRRFPVQIWYPAAEDGEPEPWISSEAAAPFSAQVTSRLGLPPFALRHLRHVATHAASGTQPIDAPLPVVMYSHGWGGFRSIQSDLAEELASLGYLVVAPDHVYGALATRYPDGEVVPIEPEALPEPEEVTEDEYARRSRLLERTYASDLLVALDALGDPDRPHVEISDRDLAVVTALRPNFDAIVMTGHSTGGGAATWACADLGEPCRGVVGFDPWLAPVAEEVLAAGSPVPYVALRSEEWLSMPNDAVVKKYLRSSQARTWGLAIPGSEHRDFTLLGFLSPLAGPLGLSGDVTPDDMHDAIAVVTITLVQHVIEGAPATLLDEAGHPVIEHR